MSATIDQVLQDAVDGGAVPGVAAIAADRNGLIYEGAAGPGGGWQRPVTADTHFRIMSMTKMVATAAALQQVEHGNLDLDAPSTPTARSSPTCRCSRASTATRRAARAGEPGHRAPARDPHRGLSATGSGTTTWCAGRRPPARRTCSPARQRDLHRPAGRRPGHAASSTASTPTGSAGSSRRRAAAARRLHGRDHRAARHGSRPAFLMSDAAARRTRCHPHAAARTARGTPARSTGRRSRTTGPAATGCTRRRATTSSSSGCCWAAATLDGVRILEQATVDAAFTNQIGELDFPAEIRPPTRRRRTTSTPVPASSSAYGLLLNTEDRPGMREPAPAHGRGCSTPTSGSTRPVA